MNLFERIQLFLFKKQFNNAKRQELLIQLSFLLKANVPPSDALYHMQQIYSDNKNLLMHAVVMDMLDNIRAGKKIGDNMTDWFPYEVCRVLSISEERGFLLQGVENLIKYFDTGRNALKALTGMIPGLAYFMVILVFIAFTGAKLLPNLGTMVKDWPAISVALNKSGMFLYHNYYFILAIVVLLIVWVIIALRDYSGKFYQLIAKPLVPTYKLQASLLLFKSLSMLTGNGVAVSDAIKMLLLNRTHGFVYRHLSEMFYRVRRGENIGNMLDTGIFTRNQIAHLKVISRYCSEAEYSKVFALMGEQTSHDLSRRMKIFSKIMNFIFIALTAIGVVWVYGAYALLVSSIT
ncbi:MAG: type II secretion system F family protein [Gammaproteobacteria bacterium]|jgi:type II secretory pathway component PulF